MEEQFEQIGPPEKALTQEKSLRVSCDFFVIIKPPKHKPIYIGSKVGSGFV